MVAENRQRTRMCLTHTGGFFTACASPPAMLGDDGSRSHQSCVAVNPPPRSGFSLPGYKSFSRSFLLRYHTELILAHRRIWMYAFPFAFYCSWISFGTLGVIQ